MKNFLTLLFAFGALLSHAQLQTLTAANTTVGSMGIVQFNNFAELGQKGNKINYSDVAGNCFWKQDWAPAVLVLSNNKTIKLKKVKLNFYSNDVHYLDNKGNELIAQTKISKILFYEQTDSSKVSGLFVFEPGFKINEKDFFAQVLNDGKLQLLKRVDVTIFKRERDPMASTNHELKFLSNEFYYLKKEGDLRPLRKINKKNISAIVRLTPDDEMWLTRSQNKLKNEEDAIAFFDHINTSPR